MLNIRSRRYAATGKAASAVGDPFTSSTRSIKSGRGGSTKRRPARPRGRGK